MRSKCSPCLPELVGPVRGADGHGQRVAAAPLDELDGLVGIGQAGVVGRDLDVFLDAAEHAQLGLDRNAPFRGPARPRGAWWRCCSSNVSCEASIITDE